jgi:hypothetical protein
MRRDLQSTVSNAMNMTPPLRKIDREITTDKRSSIAEIMVFAGA